MQDLSSFRNEIIEKCINLEFVMSIIISQHYFETLNMPFLLEVLYDDSCSFGFKRKIVEKIVPDVDKSQINNLNRLGSIRNYFAHCHPNIIDPLTGVRVAIDSKRLERTVNFERLYEEFQIIYPAVSTYLTEVLEKLTGEQVRTLSDIMNDPDLQSRLPDSLKILSGH